MDKNTISAIKGFWRCGATIEQLVLIFTDIPFYDIEEVYKNFDWNREDVFGRVVIGRPPAEYSNTGYLSTIEKYS